MQLPIKGYYCSVIAHHCPKKLKLPYGIAALAPTRFDVCTFVLSGYFSNKVRNEDFDQLKPTINYKIEPYNIITP